MNKINTIIINNTSYVQLSELCKLQPKDTNLCKSPYYIIKKYNFIKNTDYFYFHKTDNTWKIADGSNKKFHKAFVLYSVAQKQESLKILIYDDNILKNNNDTNNNTNKSNTIKSNTNNDYLDDLKKYPVINLNDGEKFRDSNNKLFDIETRGFRKHNQIYFRLSHVATCFCIPKLRDIVADKRSTYSKNIDYTYISTSKSRQSMFFTYYGLIRCLFVSRTETVNNFIDWSLKTLFTAQFGTDKQKNKLVSNIKGISYDIIHELFSKNARSLPCIYLTFLNTVDNLRELMNIDDKYNDDHFVYKFGLTKDFDNRTNGHKNEFKDIADNLDFNLVLYTYIDPLYLHDAEKDLANFVSDIKFKYKNHQEIVIIPQSYFKNIKVFFEGLGYKYSGHTAQFNKQIGDLNNNINNLQSVIANKDEQINNIKLQHQLELDKKDLIISSKDMENNKNLEIMSKNEEIYKAKMEALQFQLQYKDLLLKQNNNN